jgi:peptide-methionine (S)-S-oxide reductase
MKMLYVAGGCFWGMEELFRDQPGVVDTEVGYAGGDNEHPTYQNHPGHAEALQVTYDPSETDEATLLDYFYRIHDPTTMNRQGNDVGSSYRSTLFYRDEAEKQAAEAAIRRNQVYWARPIITTVEPLTTFWPAEDYHQDYLRKNPGGYTCHYERAR